MVPRLDQMGQCLIGRVLLGRCFFAVIVAAPGGHFDGLEWPLHLSIQSLYRWDDWLVQSCHKKGPQKSIRNSEKLYTTELTHVIGRKLLRMVDYPEEFQLAFVRILDVQQVPMLNQVEQ